ncbi:zf-HC2 domain-containing protein [Fictibacillus barbaricus]|uniref:Putative zinc-finger domain-containing protein n=1 Tax=Fictibacillus barbaricus TaxID=182136 RepID=A0ABU1TWU7_9BACL|nr:zf-HC2 domain-containing protein [Fictibacillus barbaricus]MDR7071667.1 hypothetical protein [Fictibacillus barbaricus]
MKLDCSLVEDLYPLYEEDELKLENRQAVEEHLKSCRSCSNLFQNGVGFSEEHLFQANDQDLLPKKLDDRIRLTFRLRRMKIIAGLLLAVIIVTCVNRYAANREKVATLMNGMYLYSESLQEMAKNNPYELDTNRQFIDYTMNDIMDLDNELNWLERNPLKNTSYPFFVNTQDLDEMAVTLRERRKQGLEDDTDRKAIELLQKQTNVLYKHVRNEYELFHHGYSSYFELLDVEGIGKPISKIEELSYFYTRYHKLPSEMKLMTEKELKQKVTTVFDDKDGKVELKKSLNDEPDVYHFVMKGAEQGISGKINGYTGNIFWAVNDSPPSNDKKPMRKKEIMKKARTLLQRMYGRNAEFEWKYVQGVSEDIYRISFVPVAGNQQLLFQSSDPFFIDFDARTGEFSTLSEMGQTFSKEFFAKKYYEVLSPEELERKAAKISGKKGKTVEKGIMYSTISSDYVLVNVFEGKDNFIYINAETGVVERSAHAFR